MILKRKPVLILSIVGTAYAGACVIKEILSGSNYDAEVRADDKVILITGANSGIGRSAAYQFAKRGATVYMACRDLKACEEERKEIVLTTKNRYVYCRECDLGSFTSIRKFVDIFKSEQEKLDVLINNAGVMRCPKSVTVEGIETQLGVNHMGHFLLTNLLLDTIKKSAPSRIVVVSSVAHTRGKINQEDLNSDKDYDPAEAYNQSKLANILFANELSFRLLGSDVTVNSVHPGLVDTNIARHMSVTQGIKSYFYYALAWPFIKSPYSGAQALLYAALEPSLDKVSGNYFSHMDKAEISESGKDLELAKWLWAVSEKWTRLNA